MNPKIFVAAATGLALITLSASALEFSLSDPNLKKNQNVNPQQPYEGTFDLTAFGYIPGTTIANSASFTFNFAPDGKGWKKSKVNLVFNGENLGSRVFDYLTPFSWSGTYDFTAANQPKDGVLHYVIRDVEPDKSFHNFKITSECGEVTGENPPPPPSIPTDEPGTSSVPEAASTLALLGMGLLGLTGVTRFARK